MKRKNIELFLLVIVLILIVLIIVTMCNKKSNLEVGKCTLVSDQRIFNMVIVRWCAMMILC